jgi:protein-disulfide isomerase
MTRGSGVAAALALAVAACGGSASDTASAPVFESRLSAIASQAGLDVAAWQACRGDPAMAARVTADLSVAGAVGIQATPTFLVNDVAVVGSQDASVFRTAIRTARDHAQATGIPPADYYAVTFPDVPVDGSPVLGPADAWVTIVEFSDFECPFCARVQTTLDTVLPEFGSDVRLVFKNFPLSFHAYARPAAIAAECAHAQGRFWEFHDLVFAGQAALFGGP